MAHRPTQRRNLHPPPQSNSNPSPSSSSSSTVPISKHPKSKPATTHHHHHPTPNPDLITQSFISSSRPNSNSNLHQHFSSLNLGPSKTRHTKQSQITKHSSLVDTRLQGKPMSISAIFDSAKKFSLLKPKLETERSVSGGNTNKISSKEKKPQKSKLHVLMKNEKDEIEKSRNHHVRSDDDDDVGNSKRNCSSVSVSSSSSSSPAVAPASIIRRRSLCDSSSPSAMVDLKDVFAINGVKMVSADMPPFMQIHAVDSARKAFDSMEKFTSKTLASSLKKEFDGVYGPAWHCIVGTSFGSFVTHSVGGFLYFSMDHKLYILLFKTTVQKLH